MSQELLYTSAPRGLWPGSQGYCTVACTARMPRALAERLEGLSAYRHIFPPHDPQAALNPVAFSHMRALVGGAPVHVLSRVGFAGLDYTDRTNKFAHHVALDPSELPRGGPAWLLGQPGFLRETWDGRVGFLTDVRAVPTGDARLKVCRAWQAATGDAGWAGVLAETSLADPKRPVYLVFEPGQDLLPLVAEALSLLPPERRWEVTFSTYFTNLPQGVSCAWRGVVRDSPEAVAAARTPQALVLDLGPSLGVAPAGPRVEQARTGRPAVPIPPTASAPPPLTPGRFAPQPGKPRPRRAADVPTAEVFDVVPTLPPSSAAPPPLPPGANPTPSRRGRRTALIVGASGLVLVLGGLVAWQFSRSANKGKAVNATVALNEVSSRKKEPVVAPPQPPPDRPREDVPPDPKKEVPAREAKDGKEETQEHKTAEPAKPPETPRIEYARSSCELPPANAISLENGCDLLTAPLPTGTYHITLLGLKDPQFADRLATEEKDGSLLIFAKPSGVELARISIREEKLHFLWRSGLRIDEEKSLNAIKSCVVSVEPEGESSGSKKVYRVALRTPIDVPLALALDQPGVEKPIRWEKAEKPFGRKLRILDWQASNGKLVPIHQESDDKESGRFRFADAEFDHVRLKLKLSQPGFDLRLMSWGDGSEVPTSGKNLVIVGTDNNGLLHIRIFDTTGKPTKDTNETQLPAQAAAIATLKLQLPGLLPPHLMTDAEKAQVIVGATSIVGHSPQPDASATTGSGCSVSFNYDPDEATTREKLNKEMSDYIKQLKPPLPERLKKPEQPASQIEESFKKILALSAAKGFERAEIETILDHAGEKAVEVRKQIGNIINSAKKDRLNLESEKEKEAKDNEIKNLERSRKSVAGYDELRRTILDDFQTLKQLHEIRSNPILREIKLKFTLAIDVEGEPVEVARVGVLDPKGDKVKATAGKGQKP